MVVLPFVDLQLNLIFRFSDNEFLAYVLGERFFGHKNKGNLKKSLQSGY